MRKQLSAAKALRLGKSNDEDLEEIFQMMTKVEDQRNRLSGIVAKIDAMSKSLKKSDPGSLPPHLVSPESVPDTSLYPRQVSPTTSPRIQSYLSEGRGNRSRVHQIFHDIAHGAEEDRFVDEELSPAKTLNFTAQNAEAPESKRGVCGKKTLVSIILIISIITLTSVWAG
jgi:hypothetical protein